MTYPRFWSDDFDMDLPRILPDLDDVLGDTAQTILWVHAGSSHGRLNHPSVWGVDAFYGLTADSTGKPDWYHTDHPLVECTWREAVRDAWPHTYKLLVNGVEVWDTHRLRPVFDNLMCDLRGWRRLPDRERARLVGYVRRDLARATDRVRGLAAEVVAR